MGKQIKTSKTITTVKTQICTIKATHNIYEQNMDLQNNHWTKLITTVN